MPFIFNSRATLAGCLFKDAVVKLFVGVTSLTLTSANMSDESAACARLRETIGVQLAPQDDEWDADLLSLIKQLKTSGTRNCGFIGNVWRWLTLD